jgi:hypothetical protein
MSQQHILFYCVVEMLRYFLPMVLLNDLATMEIQPRVPRQRSLWVKGMNSKDESNKESFEVSFDIYLHCSHQ